MKRQVFYSFHFKNDAWRAGQVRNIGTVEGNKPVSENEWEEVKKKGKENIKNWINEQLKYKNCTIVLIGSETANREWVKYEIKRSWETGKAIFGIYINKLKDANGETDIKGKNPFDNFTIHNVKLSQYVRTYDLPYADSKANYNYIAENIERWVELAISERKNCF